MGAVLCSEVIEPGCETDHSAASTPKVDNLWNYAFIPVLYRCETRSLTIREKHRLRAFENRVLRRIFGPKRDEVKGG
jgi:hypothetical protein